VVALCGSPSRTRRSGPDGPHELQNITSSSALFEMSFLAPSIAGQQLGSSNSDLLFRFARLVR
jgi:hypothetical protein